MQTYICKCGRTFAKSSSAETTGYALNDYGPQHECFGCPYIVTERDWQTHDIIKHECRATPKITYGTRCALKTDTGNYTQGHLYSLDLTFVQAVFDFMATLEGTEKGGTVNTIPVMWRAADFGRCYSYSDCSGLAIFPLFFKSNRIGTAAKRAVMERFFTAEGKRKDIDDDTEKKLILVQSKSRAKR